MNEYNAIRQEIDSYPMERFKYRLSLVYLTFDNVIATRKNSRVDLYLRIRKVKSVFPPDCLIIARIGFRKESVGHGTHFVCFLTEVAVKYGFKHIGIEFTNEKSSSFAKKLGTQSIDGFNYVASVEDLVSYFSRENEM
jgi:hypothetical protein